MRRRPAFIAAACLAAALALTPALAWAWAGNGGSFGSRGSLTYTPPPATSTAPMGAAPMQRSLTPQASPGYGSNAGYGRRAPFMSGLMGGLVGAGLLGLLFGHGLFGGMMGFGGVFGLLLQLALIFWAVRWVFRMLFGAPALAGGGAMNRMGLQVPQAPSMLPVSGPPGVQHIAVGPADYQAFEQLLKGVQEAWSNHDIAMLRAVATPEMVSYFAEQLGEQTSRGVHNTVTDVRLEHGDLSEAWTEDGRDYATVAMRFSMHDVTHDQAGHVVDGSLTERVSAAEIWTFMRVAGGRWILSAIQQAR